jgi:hypothetical protein
MASRAVREAQSPKRGSSPVDDEQRPPPFGAAEIGLVGVVVALAVTAFTGTGLPLPTLTIAAPLVWVPDGARSGVALVDPRSGRVEARVDAGEPGGELEVAQAAGRLAIIDNTGGGLSMLDTATLAVTGRRPVPAGGARVLFAGGAPYLVELRRGVIRRVDPSTVDDLGPALEVGQPLIDAAVDADGVLVVLRSDGDVQSVRWAEQSRTFELTAPVGSAVLADPDRSIVVLVNGDPVLGGRSRSGTGVVAVPVGAANCAQPWRPAIVGAVAYVPCQDSGQVLVLTLAGQPSGPPIDLPGSPMPVRYDGGLLIVADQQAVLVPDDGGAVRSLRLFDPDVDGADESGVL